ncbi:MAG TPA: metal-dependent transcriptional regulator [Anaerolineales bacterium]|nr:metal-dependent transcriptional regulator [Anaerolineales bacterium]
MFSHVHQTIIDPDNPLDLSMAQREYLAECYRLQFPEDRDVQTNELAERLEVSPPAVVKMLRRLVCDGYLTREPYRGVKLTPKGASEALKAIRRHRLLEAFLVTVMRFGWEEVHIHAHALEGSINEQFEDRMDELAGYPKRCPHGDPIPTKDGKMPILADFSLQNLAVEQSATISRIRCKDAEKLVYLREKGLLPGRPIKVLGRAPFNGPVRIRTGQDELLLGAELASDVWVE